MINEKFAEFNRNLNDTEKGDIAVTNDEDDYKKPRTVIESLLANHNEISYEQIRDELVTVIIGNN